MKKRYDKISTYFKENIYIVLPMCITALLFNSLMCIVPIIEGDAINSLYDDDYDKTLHLVIILISLVIFVQINRFCKRYLVRVFGNKMSLKMRQKSLDNLLHKDISYFTNNNAGDILNRNLTDIYDTTEGIRKMTTEVFDTIVLLTGYLISMFIMDFKLTLYVIPFIALSIILAELMKKLVYKTNKEYKEYLSINKQLTITLLNNELYYRGFGVSSTYYKDYEESVKILRKKNFTANIFKSTLDSIYKMVALMGVFFIIYYGGMNVINNVYLIGTLQAYLTTFLLVATKAAKVGKVFNAYQGFKVSWVRCKDYLKDEVDIIYDDNINNIALSLKDFSFEYKDSFKLPTINLNCVKGDIIGVCGKVHTGKSTLLKALSGMYPYIGIAKLDNIDLNRIYHNKTQYVSYCETNVEIFSDTLENNIKLGRNGDLNLALDTSKLAADLDSIGGIDAKLYHSMPNLSGGQQKRLQMARALYSKTPLILLDDPFQSVSLDIAVSMINRLKQYKDNIIILVSNNKNILKETNKIIFLDESKAFIGSYELLLNNSNFKALMEAN